MVFSARRLGSGRTPDNIGPQFVHGKKLEGKKPAIVQNREEQVSGFGKGLMS